MASITDINDAWIELFDDKEFKDRRFTVRYSVNPNGIGDFKAVQTDDGKRGFGDKVSSARWQIPLGWSCVLHEDGNFSDSSGVLLLQGNGKVRARADLRSFSDKTSSLSWKPTIAEASLADAWVALFDDKGFKDRCLTVRYSDHPQGIADLEMIRSDDGKMGFGDKTSSAKWLIPLGWECVLYRHSNFKDTFMVLEGSPFERSNSNFKTQALVLDTAKPIDSDGDGQDDGYTVAFRLTDGESDQASSLNWRRSGS